MKLLVAGCLIFSPLLVPLTLPAQTASGPLQLLATAQSAFEGKLTVSAVTLTGNADFAAGSTKESGSITLTARADGSSILEFSAGSASRTETQDTFANGQTCSWSNSDGIVHQYAGHNCMIPVAWYLPEPGLFSAQQPANAAFTAVAGGPSSASALRWSFIPSSGMSADQAALMEHIGSYDLQFDGAIGLPAELLYSVHPDSNAGQDIPVKVLFSDYRTVNGVTVPYRIQRYSNGVLSFDITISSATISN